MPIRTKAAHAAFAAMSAVTFFCDPISAVTLLRGGSRVQKKGESTKVVKRASRAPKLDVLAQAASPQVVKRARLDVLAQAASLRTDHLAGDDAVSTHHPLIATPHVQHQPVFAPDNAVTSLLVAHPCPDATLQPSIPQPAAQGASSLRSMMRMAEVKQWVTTARSYSEVGDHIEAMRSWIHAEKVVVGQEKLDREEAKLVSIVHGDEIRGMRRVVRTIAANAAQKLNADMAIAQTDLANGQPQVAAKKFADVVKTCHKLFLWPRFQRIEARAIGAFLFAAATGHNQTNEVLRQDTHAFVDQNMMMMMNGDQMGLGADSSNNRTLIENEQ